MKFNKILSSALVLVMLLSSIMAVIPISASAAENGSVVVDLKALGNTTVEGDDLKDLVGEYINYNYATAAEMLEAEKEKGYLVSVSAGGYNLYINRYSGFVFYENTKTGQILTSNPINPGASNGNLDHTVLSQLELAYKDASDSSSETGGSYNSFREISAEGLAISLSEILPQSDGRAGISVTYSLGVNAIDFRVPKYITEADFKDHIVNPMFKKIADAMLQYCGTSSLDYDLSDNEDIYYKGVYDPGVIKRKLASLDNHAKINASAAGSKLISMYIEKANVVFDAFSGFINAENSDKILLSEVPILREGVNVYSLREYNLTFYRLANDALDKILGSDYTSEDARADFDATGCLRNEDINSASFKISINYTLSPNGELYYEVPMSAPYFVNNNPNYSIQSLTPLKYFGAGDIKKDGYIFFPDGSGAVINFDNINNVNASYVSSVYGNDYGYSSLNPQRAHLEQITMPVYGMVGEVAANSKTKELVNVDMITNGFFAIVEEGSSLMNLSFTSSKVHDYVSVTAIYQPHPMDVRDLSETISAGTSGKYYIVSESKYEGTYRTKIVMLRDEKLMHAEPSAYEPTYIGMANCYRNYLLQNNIISTDNKSTAKSDMPLYVEVLGAMDVTQKVLSFPVVMSTPLPTFGNVYSMYSELALSGVKNINFRLTGFANGGMNSTYPAKVKWQNSLGGKKEFNTLIKDAENVNVKNDGSHLGIYPDFDFLYIHNTALFDGVGYRGTAAIMVDNRYASKQAFNAAFQLYESIFAIVVSPKAYSGLYEKFNKAYSKFDSNGLSVATLGKELNSDFDTDNKNGNREKSLEYTKQLLAKMSGEYSLMADAGNVYAMKYLDHVLNAPIDSSHYKYSSYTVPFYGMVFHGYVNYAGAPINYSGSPDYDLLRAIESGASLQYILCYDNTNYLKADKTLSKYYGVDYKNWKDRIIEQYNRLNTAIGDVQDNTITEHATLIAERVADKSEVIANYQLLINEFVLNVEAQFEAEISRIVADLRENGKFVGKTGIYANIDVDSVIAKMLLALNITEAKAKDYILDDAEDESKTLYDLVSERANLLVSDFEKSYPKSAKPYEIKLSADSINYKSKYSFETNSYATDKDYVFSSYTCANNNIVMVVYTDNSGKDTVFFINYNVYDVKVKIDAETYPGISELLDDKGYFTIEASNFVKIK